MTNSDSIQSSDFFESAYRAGPPWEIGEPQPALMALLDEYPPAGRVLDVGCGTGELALALARRGLAVLGVDFAEIAIAQANAKATAAEPEIGRLLEFRVADALHPTLLQESFGAVVDSGFYHIFGPRERESFARELAAILPSGGRYYLLGFAVATPHPIAPKQVLESELRALFAPEHGWKVLTVRPAEFVIRMERANAAPAIAACVERAPMD